MSFNTTHTATNLVPLITQTYNNVSGISDTATVTLNVNGAQAKKVIQDLTDQIDQTKEKIRQMKDAGADPKAIEKVKKQLRDLQKQLTEAQSATEGVRDVFDNLDKATPRQLEKALRTLNKQLKDMEPGSEVWDEHIEKIKALRERIAELREDLEEQETLWDKFKSWAGSAWPAIDLISRGYDQVVAKMREYVDAFADMDQEMASVIKFTGMSSREVDELNREFRAMDTRTAREQLNILAQEAGRLGKNSVEDVLGFVRAADKINVALDDLGKGATLTLSKLSGTFGVEKIYGTENSLLKIGSVINELSQNCSASAPYLADFTERMAGVGAQAGLTIQQIMGMGAVLDSSSQAVEASATAVSQVIVRLYQDPAKYAKVAGLEVESFAKLLREDANSAFILFLETLNKAGGMDVLSPMFKDMGENGSRAISALSTLADKIDQVKSQQEVANEAFREGASVGKEFDVQNNTVQAGLEKVKNAAHEYQVELGEKLYPLVQHLLSSTSAVMKGMLVAVSYIYEHRASLLALLIAYTSYNAALGMAVIRQKAMIALGVASKVGMAAYTAAVKLGTVAVSLFTLNITKARAAWQALSLALKASPLGLAAAAVAFLVSKIVMAVSATDEFAEAMDDAMKSATSFSAEARKETRELDTLFGKLQGAKKGTKEYDDAKKSIISKYGVYLQGLINERGEITNLTEAYNRLTWAARKSAQVRGVNAAKESLDSSFFKEVDDMTEKIREALQSEGMSDRQVTKLVTSISQSMAAGQDVSAADRREIMNFEAANTSSFSHLFGGQSAMGLVHELRAKQRDYMKRSDKLDSMDTRYFSAMDDGQLSEQIESLTAALENTPLREIQVSIPVSGDDMADRIIKAVGDNGQNVQKSASAASLSVESTGSGSLLSAPQPASSPLVDIPGTKSNPLVIADDGGKKSISGVVSREQAQALLNEFIFETAQRGIVPETTAGSSPEDFNDGSLETGKSTADRFAAEKSWREKEEAQARIAYAQGIDTYSEYTYKMKDIAEEYNDMLLQRDDLTSEERLKILADHWEAVNALTTAGTQLEIDIENKGHQSVLDNLKKSYTERLQQGNLSEEERKQADKVYQEAVELQEMEHLKKLIVLYNNNAAEKLKAQQNLNDKELAAAKRHQQEMEELEKQYAKMKADWFGDNPQEAQAKYDKAFQALQVVYNREIVAAEGNAAEKLRIEKAFLDAQAALRQQYGIKSEDDTRSSLQRAVDASVKWLGSDGGKAVVGTANTLVSGMSSIFSGMSSLVQAEMDIQTAKIEARYDTEIQRAEGNSYKVAKLEKEKEEEIAKAKNDANRKMFAMQVIQAVAQTATNALNAYGSAAAIPVVGHILAPIAAGMAVAAGMIQVAAIKKQQQASEAQGYSEGGFTKPGRVDEPAGIVHAGEWVASQKLLASPVARPMIEALDYAQRTNTIGTLSAEHVSRAITAPQQLSMMADADPSAALIVSAVASNAGAVSKLLQRLDEPFVTVNTVTGDKGIQKAYDEYDTLIRNKTPRSRRK